MSFDRLLVIWRDPSGGLAAGTRHVVGELRRKAEGGFAFSYRPTLPEGFALLAEFPEHRVAPYDARYLFPTFAQRVPTPTRADLAELLQAWGVEHADDPLEVLARSGGVQATDRLELAEYREDDDPLQQPLEMRISGATHFDAREVAVGDPLELRREPDNAHDSHATLILFRGTRKIGYVPRQYGRMISRLLDSGVQLRATAVRQLMLPPEGGRWVVRVARQ